MEEYRSTCPHCGKSYVWQGFSKDDRPVCGHCGRAGMVTVLNSEPPITQGCDVGSQRIAQMIDDALQGGQGT